MSPTFDLTLDVQRVLKSLTDTVHNSVNHSSFRHVISNSTLQRSTNSPDHGLQAAAVIFNASSVEEITLGSSSTRLLSYLARIMTSLVRDGDEIILTGEHEANVEPWRNIAANHTPPLSVHTWKPTSVNPNNPYALSYNEALSALSALLTPRTRIVALSGCSNILGELLNIKEVVLSIRAHSPRALVVVDLAAFAPHRSIDVRAWDVDFAVFSFHKLYGPHAAALYARHTSLGSLTARRSLPATFTPDGPQPDESNSESHEAACAVLSYLTSVSTKDPGTIRESQRVALERTSKLFEEHERILADTLLKFLTSDRARARGVRVVGPETAGSTRPPTISFIVLDGEAGECALRSRDIVQRVDALGTIRIRFLRFDLQALTTTTTTVPDCNTGNVFVQPPDEGVVRVSLVHYNTLEEVKRIVHVLEGILFR